MRLVCAERNNAIHIKSNLAVFHGHNGRGSFCIALDADFFALKPLHVRQLFARTNSRENVLVFQGEAFRGIEKICQLAQTCL